MIGEKQIAIVRGMCKRPASGSAIVVGVWLDDSIRNIEEMMGTDIKYRVLGALATDALDDKAITVITDFWPEHQEYWWKQIEKLRFRNQLIFMLQPGLQYQEWFLNRIAQIAPPTPATKLSWLHDEQPIQTPRQAVIETKVEKVVNFRKSLNAYTSMQTNHRDARNFVLDIEAKYDLEPRSTFSGGGLESVAFYNAAGEADRRFIVCFLFQDAAQVDILFGDLV